ncbi:hypothetical protein CMV_017771 [Castanea mollissima]|uniref:Uncharacterized protein n=1 Tax=Castanea mollissima TaxID=60419 RepID=A0A8J4VGU3_9ROSI|nr:hypothetical protein CMV_017771 [Castanea mollissima]
MADGGARAHKAAQEDSRTIADKANRAPSRKRLFFQLSQLSSLLFQLSQLTQAHRRRPVTDPRRPKLSTLSSSPSPRPTPSEALNSLKLTVAETHQLRPTVTDPPAETHRRSTLSTSDPLRPKLSNPHRHRPSKPPISSDPRRRSL